MSASMPPQRDMSARCLLAGTCMCSVDPLLAMIVAASAEGIGAGLPRTWMGPVRGRGVAGWVAVGWPLGGAGCRLDADTPIA